jgi:hypothetical protein
VQDERAGEAAEMEGFAAGGFGGDWVGGGEMVKFGGEGEETAGKRRQDWGLFGGDGCRFQVVAVGSNSS